VALYEVDVEAACDEGGCRRQENPHALAFGARVRAAAKTKGVAKTKGNPHALTFGVRVRVAKTRRVAAFEEDKGPHIDLLGTYT
jgi:hypothetical protein